MNGPFTLHKGPKRDIGGHRWYEISDANGIRIVDITGCLIDGSGGHKERDGYIVTGEERVHHAEWVLKALNQAWKLEKTAEPRTDHGFNSGDLMAAMLRDGAGS